MAPSSLGYKAVSTSTTITEQSASDQIELDHIQQTNNDEESEHAAKITTSRSWTERLSDNKLSIIVIGGFLLLATAIFYLTFLWFGKARGRPWSRIVLSNWVATSVAISAIVIRTVVTTQAALTTAILSQVMLRSGVTLIKLPRISSMRYSKTGPLGLLRVLVGSKKDLSRPKLSSLILLSALITTLIQFSSTLLVSDLAIATVQGPSNSSDRLTLAVLSTDDIVDYFYTDALMSTAPSYPTFAEFSSPDQRSDDPTIDDTGPVIRALMPVTSENNRSELHSFQGNASVYDARWICVQPRMTNLSLIGTYDKLELAGFAEPSTFVPPMLSFREVADWGSDQYEFNCSILPTSGIEGVWTLFTCPLSNSGIMSAIDTAYSTSIVQIVLPLTRTFEDSVIIDAVLPFDTKKDVWNGYDEFWLSTGYSYLLINVSNVSVPEDIVPDRTDFTWAMKLNDSTAWTSEGDQAWIHLESTKADVYVHVNSTQQTVSNWNVAVDASFCMSAFAYVKSMRIDAERNVTKSEPISMSDGMVQIGATFPQATLKERGILQLNQVQLRDQLLAESNEIILKNFSAPLLPVSTVFNFDADAYGNPLPWTDRIWYPSAFYMNTSFRSVHESRASLFQQVIQTTRSPALTMQSMQHTVITDRYYKYLPYFQNHSSQTVSLSDQAIQPVRHVGFTTIMVFLVVHTALVLLILATAGEREHRQQIFGSLDQVWQSYAQIMTLRNEVDGVLGERDSNLTKDRTIEKMLKSQDVANELFVLADAEHGQVRFRKRSPS